MKHETTCTADNVQASILVGLLWCLAILSVLVVSLLHTTRLDLRVVKNYGDLIQAHYLALAGIEKAKALLYHDTMERRQNRINHSGQFFDAPQYFRDVPFGRGRFRVFRQGRRDEGGRVIYGVSDEESRLNVNAASADELGQVQGMIREVVAAILDWRDKDSVATTSGAEADYYALRQPPCLPRNGPLQTPRELLMVRGVSRDLFLEEDVNQNGLLDPEEDDGNDSFPPDNRDGLLEAGWSGLLTVDSSVRNVNAAGDDRINIQTADEPALASVRGISAELAQAIVAYRGQNRLESVADLLDVVAVKKADPTRAPENRPPNQPGQPGSPLPQTAPPPNAPAAPTGEKLVSEDLLMDIADDLTSSSDQDLTGLININTASPAVLACLPGIDLTLAQAIVSYRLSSGFFPNIACLLKVPGMNRQLFKRIAPRLSARSETFRILSEGKVSSTGARRRIQVIVHIGSDDLDTLAYREDL